MWKLNRVIAIVLFLCLFLGTINTSYAAPISIEGADQVYVCISNGDASETYLALITSNDIYLSAKSFGDITKYKFIDGSARYGYKLGRKLVSVDKATGEIDVDLFNIKNAVGDIMSLDGEDYLSASCLLPWLNVSCNVNDDDRIEIIPDEASLWDVIYDIDYNADMFNISTDIGTSTKDTVGLISTVVFDTIINVRWDRLIPSMKADSKWYETVYDYKCYVNALTEMATDGTEGFFSKADRTTNAVLKASKSLGDIYDSFNCDLFHDLDPDDEAVQMLQEFLLNWEQFREITDAFGNAKKYFDILGAFKTYELFLNTSVEYREYISWLSHYDTGNALFNHAAREVDLKISDRKGSLFTLAIEFGRSLFKELPEKWIEGALKDATDDILQTMSNSLSKGFFHSLSTYMLGAKAFFKAVFPITKGYSEISKIGILEAIQDDSYNIALDLMHEKMTKENVMHIRQSMIMALQSSKMCYDAFKQTTDAKILNCIDIFQTDGAFDFLIDGIDEKIAALIASRDYTENDSIEGKKEYEQRLKDSFSQLRSIYDNNGEIGKKPIVSNINSIIETRDTPEGYIDWLEITASTAEGTVVWTYTSEDNLILSSQAQGMVPAFVFNSEQVVFSSNGYLYSLDKQTGKQLWAVNVEGNSGSLLSNFKEYDGNLYYYNLYGHLYIISRDGDVIIDSDLSSLSYLSLFCFLEIEEGGILQISYEYADPSYQYNENIRDYIIEQQYDWGSTYTLRYDPLNGICLPWPEQTIRRDEDSEIDIRSILIYSDWSSLDEITTLSGEKIDVFFFYGSLLKYGTHAVFREDGTFEFNIALRYYTGSWKVEDDEIVIDCTPIPDDPSYIGCGSTITAAQLREQPDGDYVLVLTLDDSCYLFFSRLGMCYD